MKCCSQRQDLQLVTEYPSADEACHADHLVEMLAGKMERDYAADRFLRDAHPKMHGCVRAEFAVEPNQIEDLRLGVFREPRTYQAWVRFSNQSGNVSKDFDKDIRGAAIKLLDVAGEKLLAGETQAKTQDFILISDNRFVTRDIAEFDALVTALLRGGLHVAWFFLTHWRVARNLLASLKRCSSPLDVRYNSVAPYLLGRRAVKYRLQPQNPTSAAIPPNPPPDYLREAMVHQLRESNAVFDFSVQFQTDAVTMPIEDPGVAWDEALSPFLKVATLTIPRQEFDSPEQREFGDNLSFNPWHSLAVHRPLGGINRARRRIYHKLSAFRHQRNHVPVEEPTSSQRP
jgi:hypothetical protein